MFPPLGHCGRIGDRGKREENIGGLSWPEAYWELN